MLNLEERLNKKINLNIERVWNGLNNFKKGEEQYIIDKIQDYSLILDVLENRTNSDMEKVCIMKIRTLNSIKDLFKKDLESEDFNVNIENLKKRVEFDYEVEDEKWLKAYTEQIDGDEDWEG